MRYYKHQLKFAKGKDCSTFLVISDSHIGNKAFHKEGTSIFIDKAMKYPWIHLGDIIESITPDDRRFSAESHDATLMAQAEYSAELFGKAHKTCWGLMMGNHEWRVSTKVGDLTNHIVRNINEKHKSNVPYLTMMAFIDIICPAGKCRSFFTHGGATINYRAGEPERKSTNKKIRLKDLFSEWDADLYGMGHGHTGIVKPAIMVEKTTTRYNDNIPKRRPVPVSNQWYFMCPAMFKAHDIESDMASYAEAYGYGATALGWIEIDIRRDGVPVCIRIMRENGTVRKEYFAELLD